MEENFDILFRNYTEGHLSQEEGAMFESRLASDSEFQEVFSDYQLGSIAGRRLVYKDLKVNVAEIAASEDRRRRSLKIYKIVAIAAVIIALLVTLSWLFRSEDEPEALYASYYQKPEYNVSRGEITTWTEAINSFLKEDYSAAISILTKSDSLLNSAVRNQRLLAHSYLNADSADNAIPIFKETSKVGPTAGRSDDIWYLALAFLKNEQLDSSAYYLDVLKNDPAASKQQNATDLLKKVEQLKK